MDGRTVRSVVLQSFGNHSNIKIENIPINDPEKLDEVKIDVFYCGLNFCDIITRIGLLGVEKKPPFTLGIECAGVVSDLGPQSLDNPDLPELKIGDRVICYNYLGGLFSEQVICSRKQCYLLPEAISLKHGIALFINYITAYICLYELGNLKEYEKVLIKASAGGVGWAATQLAKNIPNTIIFGTASDSKHHEILLNGVTAALSNTKYLEHIKKLSPDGIDLILENDAIGDEFIKNRALLKPLGRIVTIGANNMVRSENKPSLLGLLKIRWNQKDISLQELMANSRTISGFHLGVLAEMNPKKVRDVYKTICELFLNKKLKPRIDSEWKMDDFIDATKRMEDRKNIGKIILKIK